MGTVSAKFAIALLALCPALAHAASMLTYTTSDPVALTATDWGPTTLDFQQFDQSLGTLESVTLTLVGGLSTNVTVTCMTTTCTNMGGYADLALIFSNPSNASDPVVTAANNANYDIASYLAMDTGTVSQGTVFSVGPLGADPTGQGGIFSDPTLILDLNSDFSEFEGPGSYGLTVETSTEPDVTYTGGNATAVETTEASLTGTVTYAYAENDFDTDSGAPEPGSLILFGGGLLAIGLLGRLRRKA